MKCKYFRIVTKKRTKYEKNASSRLVEQWIMEHDSSTIHFLKASLFYTISVQLHFVYYVLPQCSFQTCEQITRNNQAVP